MSDNTPTPRIESSQLWFTQLNPHPGYLISAPPPQQSSSTTLRLLNPLGHGSFSSVWLAHDTSPVPIALRSRRSLRDLRKQASLSSSPSSQNLKVPPVSLSLSRAGSLNALRKRVSGTRPISIRGEKLDFLDHTNGTRPLISNRDRDRAVAVPVDLPLSLSRSSSASSASSTSSSLSRNRNVSLSISIEEPHQGGLSRNGSIRGRSAKVRLVAVKMTLRGGASVGGDEEHREEREREKERTRVAFVREVEVLRHISHPNITPLLTHLSTPTHHVLVLPYVPGGDLLALVNSDSAWSHLRESVLRRIWSEICRAVEWMHGVGLVHRDVKLENILLTTPIFAALAQPPDSAEPSTPNSDTTPTPSPPRAPTLEDLPPSPAPLIKLTDFGLSRFVDIRTEEEKRRDREARKQMGRRRGSESESSVEELDAFKDGDGDREEEEEEEEEYEGPLLSTRCGSEAYAAPELVMGGARGHGGKGVYDARETDAWACGVVLYALVARRLPFGEGVEGAGAVIKGEGAESSAGGAVGRRQWLMRIAKGEYDWPELSVIGEGVGQVQEEGEGEGGELIGRRLVESEGARRMVGRLLVRDPKKRARVGELWSDEWTGGGGEYKDEEEGEENEHDIAKPEETDGEYDFCHDEEMEMEMEMEELEKEEEEEDGWLVDQDGIDSIARREVV